jgi:hypothetical protein
MPAGWTSRQFAGCHSYDLLLLTARLLALLTAPIRRQTIELIKLDLQNQRPQLVQ